MATAAALAINSAATYDQMFEQIFGNGVSLVANSATFSGNAASTGIFSGATTTSPGISPTASGVILSTGNASAFANAGGGTNTNLNANTGTNVAGGIDGDAQLNAIAGVATFDGAILSASFIPDGNYITMQFVFSSEEYPEYINQNVNDAFGVWVNGAFVPISVVTAGNVAIDTVNAGVNNNLYIDNTSDQFNTEMDGFTRVLSFKALVNPGQVNTIKIGIADGGDAVYDSNLLIMADSVQAVTLAFDDTINVVASGTKTYDILANDADLTGTGLTITQINGVNVAAGQTIVLPSGQSVTLNANGTVTVLATKTQGTVNFSYTVVDGQGTTDVGYITLNTGKNVVKDGIVSGTTGGDLINTAYVGDPEGDRVDNNDATGIQGTVGNDDIIYAGAGNDSIYSGLGNDKILSGAGNDLAFGGAGNDSITGDAGNDTLNGDAGNDTLDGGLGNDTLFGGSENDMLYGGAGSDSLSGDAGNDTLYGGAGNDVLSGGAGVDVLNGGDGNDTLSGGAGSDNMAGGAGDDRFILGDGAAGDTDTIIGGESGETTGDALDAVNITNGVNVQFTGNENGTATSSTGNAVFSEIENVYGGAGNDTINASVSTTSHIFDTAAGDDSVVSGSGNDTISGGAGADTLDGGAGNDIVNGGTGNDILTGGAGNDSLYGGDDVDYFYGGAGDVVDGGEGGNDNDTLNLIGVSSITYGGGNNEAGTVNFTAGGAMTFANIEKLVINGGPNGVVDGLASGEVMNAGYTDLQGDQIDGADGDPDTIYGNGGNDTINASNGNDLVYGGTGDDSIFGNAGSDTLYGDDGNDFIEDYEGASTVYGGAGNDTIYTGDLNDQIYGGNDADLIYANSGNDTIDGGAGHDSIYAGEGNDSVLGGAGNDLIQGGFGDDSLYGGDDADIFYGGAGDVVDGGEGGNDNDTLYLSDVTNLAYGGGNDEAGTVTFQGGGTMTFSNIEKLVLNGGNPDGIIYGTAAAEVIGAGYVDANGDVIDNNDAIYGTPGSNDDEIYAGDGADTVYGLLGNDTIYGGAGGDLVHGGVGNDYIQGDAGNDGADVGNDTLYGDEGNDFIRGDNGSDYVYGGVGDDTVYGGAGTDHVYGGDGNDVVYGGYGDDTVYGGAGDDTITGSADNDVAYGDDGNDYIQGGEGADTLYGGLGNDTLLGEDDGDTFYGGVGDYVDGYESVTTGTDNDTLYVTDVSSVVFDVLNPENGVVHYTGGGTLQFYNIENLYVDGVLQGPPNYIVDGTTADDLIDGSYVDAQGDRIDAADNVAGNNDDVVMAGSGDDTVIAGQGNDLVYGGDGDDRLSGDVGNDTLNGDAGNDVLLDGAGDDVAFGGSGNDSFTSGSGADSLYGGADSDHFDGDLIGDVIDGGVGGDDNDTLDLRAYGKLNTNIIYDPQNSENGTVEFLDENGAVTGTMTFTNIENVIPCFTPGCMVLTDSGEISVQNLRVGDAVLTRDNGYQPIRWIGNRDLSQVDLLIAPQFSAVQIARGALGHNLPERDMKVSPQHRMLLSGPRAEMLFGEHEVLVAANHLVGRAGITRRDGEAVRYIHILFDQHEIIRADGAWSESFQPGDRSLAGMDAAQRAEILGLFPNLAGAGTRYPAARMTLKSREARVLLSA